MSTYLVLRFARIALLALAPVTSVLADTASREARLASCDDATVANAIIEITHDPNTLKEPLMLFQVVSAEFSRGRTVEAAYWYLIARLRGSRQLLFDSLGRELMTIMAMSLGPGVMPYLEANPEIARVLVRDVLEWDRTHPDPYRDRPEAKRGDFAERLAKIEDSLRALPDELSRDPERANKARKALPNMQRLEMTTRDMRCASDTLDAADLAAAIKKINSDAERLVMVHPLIRNFGKGVPKSVSTAASRIGKSKLPSRLTLSIRNEVGNGQSFFAEVDVSATIVDRKVDSVKLTLACVTPLWIGQRDARWKDVCADDPAAVRPSPDTADLLQYASLAEKRFAIENSKPLCEFSGLSLPADFAVLATGNYSGRNIGIQIDQSGHEATQMDVSVNYTAKPVVLMLGAYEPTIWKVRWSEGTKIIGALVGGYHRQGVAGLDKSTPVLVSTFDNKGPCGYFYVAPNELGPLNPLSRRLFGRPVDMVYPVEKKSGIANVGDPTTPPTQWKSSPDVTVESFVDPAAPLAGLPGLEAATRKGQLRKATIDDARAWATALAGNSHPTDLPPVAGKGATTPPLPSIFNAFVVLGPFVYPAGLYGGNSAAFFIPKGVPKPQGNPGHSSVYDYNTLAKP